MPHGRAEYCYHEVLPFAAMVVSECLTVGLTTIYKAAVLNGLSYHIFMLYSYAISSLLLLPLAYISQRLRLFSKINLHLELCKFWTLISDYYPVFILQETSSSATNNYVRSEIFASWITWVRKLHFTPR